MTFLILIKILKTLFMAVAVVVTLNSVTFPENSNNLLFSKNR
jgi:hypothetical protein